MFVRPLTGRCPVLFPMFSSISSPFFELEPYTFFCSTLLNHAAGRPEKNSVGPKMAVFRSFPRGKKVLGNKLSKISQKWPKWDIYIYILTCEDSVENELLLFFFASALSALYLSTDPSIRSSSTPFHPI